MSKYVISVPTGRPNAQGKKTGPPAYFIDGDEINGGWDRDFSRAHRFESADAAAAFRDKVIARSADGSKARARSLDLTVEEVAD